ncbi:hypothetical protein HC024_05405 [Methylococcaceae bacterium WWC4]|nr:hypothetical protein [Methylococcaceae bacterium WWC4]
MKLNMPVCPIKIQGRFGLYAFVAISCLITACAGPRQTYAFRSPQQFHRSYDETWEKLKQLPVPSSKDVKVRVDKDQTEGAIFVSNYVDDSKVADCGFALRNRSLDLGEVVVRVKKLNSGSEVSVETAFGITKQAAYDVNASPATLMPNAYGGYTVSPATSGGHVNAAYHYCRSTGAIEAMILDSLKEPM